MDAFTRANVLLRRGRCPRINRPAVRAGVEAARSFTDRDGGHDLIIAAAEDGEVAGFFVGDENLVATIGLAVSRKPIRERKTIIQNSPFNMRTTPRRKVRVIIGPMACQKLSNSIGDPHYSGVPQP